MKIVRTIFWWAITIITLFILDDMVFGPIFWSIALINQALSTVLAFALSWSVGVWLVFTGLKESPGRFAKFMLDRLMLGHKSVQIHHHEESLRRKVVSATGALIVTPLIGGVIPSLVLHRRKLLEVRVLRRYAILLCGVYAIEFAALHGGWGLGGIARAIFT